MSFRLNLETLSEDSDRKVENFGVFDIEGKNWKEFLVAGFYNGKEYHYFYDMLDLIDFCFECEESVFYAHFGGIYDFMFVFEEVHENTDYSIESIIPRGSGILSFDVKRVVKRKIWDSINKQYRIIENYQKITFRDSSALLPFSLKKITESFGVHHSKKDMDVENLEKVTEELLEYLEYDCKGLYESIKAYYEWPLIKKAGPASTMASQALRVLRLFLKRPIPSLRKRVDEFVRKSYFGGRTEVFKPIYEGTKTLKCYDVNSLYPTVMRNNDFPTEFRGWTLNYKPDVMGFYEALVEVPKDMYIPPLPTMEVVNKNKKLIFPTGKFWGVWSTAELEHAKSVGVKILKTGKGAIFENGGPIFKDYIDTLYEMRLDAKENGDGVGDILTKLLMNSCYGRFGLDTHKEQLVFDDFQSGVSFHSELKFKNRTVRLMRKKVDLEKTFTNVAVAAWVTSLARVHMHRIFMKSPKSIYYTDTDSLFTSRKLKTGEGLGELKLEYEFDKAVFLLPKTYVAQKGSDFKKLAMKGFDKKKIKHFKFEDFKTALEGDLRHMKVTHDVKFAKFRTAVRKGSFLELMPEQDRQIRSLYDKRKILKSGKNYYTLPLHIENTNRD